MIGVLSAMNKRDGHFEMSDIELLDMIAGNVALSIDNARFSDELKAAQAENETKMDKYLKDLREAEIANALAEQEAQEASVIATLEARWGTTVSA